MTYYSSFRSIIVAADESLVTWGPSPTYGELVSIINKHGDVRMICITFHHFLDLQNYQY